MNKVTKMDQKERFIELRAKEVPYEIIAKELGISNPTLLKWGKEFEVEISNLWALELQFSQDEFFVSKTKRIGLFGEQLTRLKERVTFEDTVDRLNDSFVEWKA